MKIHENLHQTPPKAGFLCSNACLQHVQPSGRDQQREVAQARSPSLKTCIWRASSIVRCSEAFCLLPFVLRCGCCALPRTVKLTCLVLKERRRLKEEADAEDARAPVAMCSVAPTTRPSQRAAMAAAQARDLSLLFP